MKTIRKGNDIVVRWRIFRYGQKYDIALIRESISLVLSNMGEKKEITDYNIVDVNTIVFKYRAEDQGLGIYRLLLIDKSRNSTRIIEECNAFRLVNTSDAANNDDTLESAITITLTSELTAPADGLSAYEVALQNGFIGTEEEWLQSLVPDTTDIELAEAQRQAKELERIEAENARQSAELERQNASTEAISSTNAAATNANNAATNAQQKAGEADAAASAANAAASSANAVVDEFNSIIVQETGAAQNKVMSQKAVTDAMTASQAKLSELESKTSELEKVLVTTTNDFISIEDNNGNEVFHLDDNGLNAKNIKSNGKGVLTEHQDISGLQEKLIAGDNIKIEENKISAVGNTFPISEEKITDNNEEVIYSTDSGEEILKINKTGVFVKGESINNKYPVKVLSTLNRSYNCAYISSDGSLNSSSRWSSWIIPANSLYNEIDFECYNNDASFFNVAYYNGTPSSVTFLGGLKVSPDGELHKISVRGDAYPTAKFIVFSSRIENGDYTKITAMSDEGFSVPSLDEMSQSNIKSVAAGIQNTNDFVIIKDELWMGINIYVDGVASETLNITRYKLNIYGEYEFLSKLTTDWGHWNSVDYNEDNDCLIFTNSANIVSEEGNYFVVVKNPRALEGTANKSECGIIYNVNLGYKVNAVWGHTNISDNNIVYILSNNAAKFTSIILKKDQYGVFNGEFDIIETKDTGMSFGIGGMAHWGDSIIIGDGVSYGLKVYNVSEGNVRNIKREYFKPDGTKYVGSTQGVCINKDYLWVFNNVGGSDYNFLIQYNR